MEKVIYNLVFNRKKQLNPEGKALIQVEAYWRKQKKYFSTKVYIKPNQWDKKRRSIKNHSNMDALNTYLQTFILDLERKELQAVQSGKGFSLNDLKDMAVEEKATTFTQFMQKEIEQSHLKLSTMKNHFSTLHLVTQFKSSVAFEEITFNFLCDFENYLLQNNYHRNTIAKHMKHLKRYVNLAINKDMFEMHRYPFRKYKIRYMETKRTHLTPEELHQLESLDLSHRRSLQKCLDMFLFSCYTGLRFSDVVSIRKENFLNIDEKLWLVYSSVKTDVNVRLPLSRCLKEKPLLFMNGIKEIPVHCSIYQQIRTRMSISNLSGSVRWPIWKRKSLSTPPGIPMQPCYYITEPISPPYKNC